LLVFFVVGIFDFSGAIALKNKLANAAREGARVAAADPANDLGNPLPASIIDAAQVVDNYLTSEKINDCGLSTATLGNTGGLTWGVTTTGTGCPGGATPGLQLTVNRGCTSQQVIDTATVNLVSTCVTILYPYVWQFNGVAGLFGSFSGPTNIKTTAVAFNEN
jgi:Flp pilus assembly protein TadG